MCDQQGQKVLRCSVCSMIPAKLDPAGVHAMKQACLSKKARAPLYMEPADCIDLDSFVISHAPGHFFQTIIKDIAGCLHAEAESAGQQWSLQVLDTSNLISDFSHAMLHAKTLSAEQLACRDGPVPASISNPGLYLVHRCTMSWRLSGRSRASRRRWPLCAWSSWPPSPTTWSCARFGGIPMLRYSPTLSSAHYHHPQGLFEQVLCPQSTVARPGWMH